eukprot:Skav232099  [mRNA]  locus=scaffold2353:97127:104376:+ [translate_table: standard]
MLGCNALQPTFASASRFCIVGHVGRLKLARSALKLHLQAFPDLTWQLLFVPDPVHADAVLVPHLCPDHPCQVLLPKQAILQACRCVLELAATSQLSMGSRTNSEARLLLHSSSFLIFVLVLAALWAPLPHQLLQQPPQSRFVVGLVAASRPLTVDQDSVLANAWPLVRRLLLQPNKFQGCAKIKFLLQVPSPFGFFFFWNCLILELFFCRQHRRRAHVEDVTSHRSLTCHDAASAAMDDIPQVPRGWLLQLRHCAVCIAPAGSRSCRDKRPATTDVGRRLGTVYDSYQPGPSAAASAPAAPVKVGMPEFVNCIFHRGVSSHDAGQLLHEALADPERRWRLCSL